MNADDDDFEEEEEAENDNAIQYTHTHTRTHTHTVAYHKVKAIRNTTDDSFLCWWKTKSVQYKYRPNALV